MWLMNQILKQYTIVLYLVTCKGSIIAVDNYVKMIGSNKKNKNGHGWWLGALRKFSLHSMWCREG